jgi:serine/threonine protein kinase
MKKHIKKENGFLVKTYQKKDLLASDTKKRIEQINSFEYSSYKALTQTTITETQDGYLYTQPYFKKVQKTHFNKSEFFDLAYALEYLQSIGFIHGDINSKNVIYTDDGFKIIDFEPSLVQIKNGVKQLMITMPYAFKNTLKDEIFNSSLDKLGFFYFLLRVNKLFDSKRVVELRHSLEHSKILKEYDIEDISTFSFRDIVDKIYRRINMKISKSLFTKGLQCEKSLWLKVNRPELIKKDSSKESIFETGTKVGELACELFKDGIKVEYDKNLSNMILDTKKLLEKHNTLFEASFEYDDVFVSVDILEKKDDVFSIREVKSSSWSSKKKLSNIAHYIDDIAVQYYVLNGNALKVEKCFITLLNSNYVRGDALDVRELFVDVDVTKEVLELQTSIKENIAKFKNVLENKDEPNIAIHEKCFKPYECEFKQHCWADVPSGSVFEIAGVRKPKVFNLFNDGIKKIEDIKDISAFSENQQIQIKAEDVVKKEAIKEFLDTLTYPIYHLDFETYQEAIPTFKYQKPFEKMPFQYSLHIEYEDGTLKHKEFLAVEGKDPREELAKRLVEDIPKDVTVLAYHKSFENGVIERLAELFEKESVHLLNIAKSLKDLEEPFSKKLYYTSALNGSSSIKKVLPALVPEMRDAYDKLEMIHNGGDAMDIYPKLVEMDEDEKVKTREALLEYCKLDTFAMVKVLEVLNKK